MIGKLSGRLDYRSDDHILLDVKGVGYIVYVSDRVMASLPSNGEMVALYTDLLVREDNLQLFGFTSLVEKEWHRLLMSVQGIGAKASLAILGTLGSDGVSHAIALGDFTAIARAKGVGPKTAKKVILDLKDKAPTVMSLRAAPLGTASSEGADTNETTPSELVESETATPKRTAAPSAPPQDLQIQADALSALCNLGYSQGDAASAIAQSLRDNSNQDMSSLIKDALKRLIPQ